MPRGEKLSLALNEPQEIGCSSFRFKHFLQNMHHKQKEIIETVCKTTNKKSYGPTPNKKFH
jgi:hypothetical protein